MGKEIENQCFFISESTIVGIYLFQEDKFLYVNPAFARIFGYHPAEIMKRLGPLDITHPEDRNLVEKQIQARLQGDIDYVHYTFRGLKKDGNTVVCEVYGKRVDYDGIPSIAGTIIDISERIKAEERLFWELAVGGALSELAKALADPLLTTERIAKTILEHARSLTKSEYGFISSIDPATEKEMRRAFIGIKKGQCPILYGGRKATFSKGPDGLYPGLWGYALNTKEGFFTNTPFIHQAAEGIPNGHIPIRNFLSAPAVVGDEVMGQIALANSPEDYTNRELDAVQRLADIYALATKREREEESLLESEQKYKALTEHSLTGIFILQQGKYVFVNRRFAKMHGYSPKELLGKHHVLLVHPQDRDACKAILSRQSKGKKAPKEYEIRRITKDGEILWCKVMVARIRYRGKPAVMGNVIDITHLKEMEIDLRHSLEKWQRTLEETVYAFATAVEQRDPYTAGHQKRVAELAYAISKEMNIPKEDAKGIYMAGLVHDIGKISVPAEILSKPGRLTEAEFEMLRAHPQSGYEILKEIEFPWPIADLVLQHHERLDGSGYPQGLKNGEILLGARILAVADVVEAMASYRPYRPALGIDAALEEISRGKGTLYDPRVVDTCIRLFREKGYKFE